MENTKLYQAITEGKEEEALSLLADPENESDLKIRDSNGHTLFHMAVLKIKSVLVFKELLKKVDFTVRDEDGNSAIDLMLDDEDFPDEAEEALKEFLKEKFSASKIEDLESYALNGWTTWLDLWSKEEGSIDDDKEDVKEFIAKLPEKGEKVQGIHNAVNESKWDLVREFLEDGSLLKAVDRTGLPPLQKAVILGEVEIVQNIIKEFSEALTITDNMGRTALHYAAGRRDGGHLYQILQDAGAQDDIQDLNGRTPKEIFEEPDLLPGEKIAEKLKEIMAKPVLTSKRKKAVQTEQQTEEEDAKPSTPAEQTTAPPRKVEDTKPKPVQMYISPDVRPNPPPTTIDGKYVADHLGQALTDALAEIAEKRPWDPIEFLGQWLYKYHENMTNNKRQKELLAQIREEEKARELEREIKEKRKLELQRLQEEERKKQQAEEEERKRKEHEELQRKAKEAALSQQPGLETVMEDKEEDDTPQEKSHKDENGQTELHKLAAQSAADLTTLLNMGYSPADRDINNKTPRDIAVECKINDNVEAIDKYMLKLVEMEEFEKIQELILAGYDKFDVVLDKLKEQTHSLPEDTKQFLEDLPELQSRLTAVFKAVQTEGLRDLNQALDRKKLAEAKDPQGRSPLHMAVLVGHKEAVEHLVNKFPVSMKCKDNLERTPLHYAMAVSEDMVAILEKHGADQLALDVLQRPATYYRDNPDEIKSMTESLTSLYTGTQEQTAQETSQEEGTTQETSQQEETTPETSPQEDTEPETSQQEAT